MIKTDIVNGKSKSILCITFLSLRPCLP